MKIVDIILISALAALVCAAIISIIIRKTKGKSCCGSCDNCSYKCKSRQE